jgi:hypothetical protein
MSKDTKNFFTEREIMKRKVLNERDVHMFRHLSELPRKIVKLHGLNNITEFVLHDLCHPDCFNLKKAAYFVDNPDFDCLKGVAGFHHEEVYPGEDIWFNPQSFSDHMETATFNKKVRQFHQKSEKKHNSELSEGVISHIASDMDFENPSYFTWDLKHDNAGLLVYQRTTDHDAYDEKDIINGLSLLSFCPIF